MHSSPGRLNSLWQRSKHISGHINNIHYFTSPPTSDWAPGWLGSGHVTKLSFYMLSLHFVATYVAIISEGLIVVQVRTGIEVLKKWYICLCGHSPEGKSGAISLLNESTAYNLYCSSQGRNKCLIIFTNTFLRETKVIIKRWYWPVDHIPTPHIIQSINSPDDGNLKTYVRETVIGNLMNINTNPLIL